ncbi:MAG TPA: thioesterase [Trebonia sp.]|nr:thioesterase [Trebonia sp.]
MAKRDSTGQTDVFLDVPELKVDEIDLKVEGLRAKVSLQAEVLQLLKLNVGVDACLDCVDLTIRGVEAQAQLQVRLDNVVAAIERVLETVDNHPDILTNITSGAGRAVEDVGGGAKEAVPEVGKGAGEATKQVGGGAGEATREVGGGAGEATKQVGGGAGEAAKDVGGGAEKATKGISSVPTQAARHVASEAGKKAKDMATRELVSTLGNRTADAAERVIKRFTTKED